MSGEKIVRLLRIAGVMKGLALLWLPDRGGDAVGRLLRLGFYARRILRKINQKFVAHLFAWTFIQY